MSLPPLGVDSYMIAQKEGVWREMLRRRNWAFAKFYSVTK